jgi:hypothetical protein
MVLCCRFLLICTVTGDEVQIQCYEPENKKQCSEDQEAKK